jgi:hypothetical protein
MGHEKNPDTGNSGGVNDKDLLDSVGKKNDNAGGTSLVSMSKDLKLDTVSIKSSIAGIKAKTDTIPAGIALAADSAVSAKNSAANVGIRDAIGNKTDDSLGTSIFSLLYRLVRPGHSVGKVYPLLANPITLTKAVNAWVAFSASKTEIIPVNTVTSPFNIHFILVSTLSAVGDYVIALYSGAAGAEVLIGYVPASRSATGTTEGLVPATTTAVPANTRISAALTSGNAAADTARIKVFYHEY